MAGKVKLTKAQISALDLMAAIGTVYPSKACGSYSTFNALDKKGFATRRARIGPFDITPAGRAALSQQTGSGETGE